MKKYRKKPVIVEAEQYLEDNFVKGICLSASCYRKGNTAPHVHTIHDNQILLLEEGDYVIKEPDGKHYYACKPDIFRENHELIDDQTPNTIFDKKPAKWISTRIKTPSLHPLYRECMASSRF